MLSIRKAKSERDFRLLRGLDDLIFPDDEAPDVTLAEWWLAFDEDEPVAFAGLVTYTGFLFRAGVLPAYRGCGLQRRLLKVRLRAAKASGLEEVYTYTTVDNVPSMRNLIRAGLLPYNSDCEFLWFKKSL